MDGYIELYIGCMFSGKTSTMLDRVNRHKIAGKKCVIVRYKKDNRYGAEVVNHAGHGYPSIDMIAAENLGDITDRLVAYDVIGVDEIQFYPDVVEVLHNLANAGKIIIGAGLDGTFAAEPFGRVHKLIPLAERVTKLNAVCMICGKDASFTKRLINSTVEVDIGGTEKYQARCRKCMWNI